MKKTIKKTINAILDIKNYKIEIKAKQNKIHFLHIGKCAGTHIKKLIKQINKIEGSKIIAHDHDIKLINLPLNADYFFSIRDPISRFYSGFYGRKKRGRPLYNYEHSEHEKLAFINFPEANDLAENLFEKGEIGYKAIAAMKSIGHISCNQFDWMNRRGNFLITLKPIWIIRQEKFDDDFKTFLEKINLAHLLTKIDINKDPITSHTNNYDGLEKLSNKAIENLKKWYSSDIMFYDMCSFWLDNHKK